MRLEVLKDLRQTDNPIAVFEDKNRRFITINHDSLIDKYKDLSGAELKEMLFNKKNRNVMDFVNTKLMTDKYSGENGISIKNKSMMFMPDFHKERELIYIFGPSGSGKSYLTKKFVNEFKLGRPDYDVFLFSKIDDDPSFEDMKYVHIGLTLETLEGIDLSTLENSLCIFDDTDTISDKDIDKKIWYIKDLIAQEGRHKNISMITTTHMACNYNKTRIILNECQKYVIFPKGNGVKQMQNMFCSYGGMSKSKFEYIRNLDTRWCMLNTSYPNYIVYESGVELL